MGLFHSNQPFVGLVTLVLLLFFGLVLGNGAFETLAADVDVAEGFKWLEPPFIPVAVEVYKGCTSNAREVQDSKTSLVVVKMPCECESAREPSFAFRLNEPSGKIMYQTLMDAMIHMKKVQIYYFSPEEREEFDFFTFKLANGTKPNQCKTSTQFLRMHGLKTIASPLATLGRSM